MYIQNVDRGTNRKHTIKQHRLTPCNEDELTS